LYSLWGVSAAAPQWGQRPKSGRNACTAASKSSVSEKRFKFILQNAEKNRIILIVERIPFVLGMKRELGERTMQASEGSFPYFM
jgi:hypothetical protein